MKKCWSWPGSGVVAVEFAGEAAGIGGTGGMRSGVDSTDRLVTPGM